MERTGRARIVVDQTGMAKEKRRSLSELRREVLWKVCSDYGCD